MTKPKKAYTDQETIDSQQDTISPIIALTLEELHMRLIKDVKSLESGNYAVITAYDKNGRPYRKIIEAE